MYTFNPVKEFSDGKEAEKEIWSTKSIELAIEGLNCGKRLKVNPFYEKETKLLKRDLLYDRTPDEIKEFKKCAKNVIYFAKYCKLLTPEGIQNIKLRDYQRDYLKHLQKNRLSIFLSCRQSGKTTTSAIFMLWYILFNVDKNSLVLGNKRKTAVEILDKIKKIFYELPYFLKPGIIKWNESEIVLDNGCRCMSESTTVNSGISFTFHCILADEFAHIPPNIMDKFYNNIFPTITAANARFMITSTQNGDNLFRNLWNGAINHLNEYAPFKVDWWQVVDWDPKHHKWVKRDEKWKQLQTSNLGGEIAFNSQFGTEFVLGTERLIPPDIIKDIVPETWETQDVQKILPYTYSYWVWKPEYDILKDKDTECIYTVTLDPAEGVGRDYSVICLSKVNRDKFVNVVGIMHCNNVQIVNMIQDLQSVLHFLPSERTLFCYEGNQYGLYIRNLLMNDYELLYNTYCDSITDHGFLETNDRKMTLCYLLRDSLTTKSVNFSCNLFLQELEYFIKVKNTFQAKPGFHDDIIMSFIQVFHILETPKFKIRLNSIETMETKSRQKTVFDF